MHRKFLLNDVVVLNCEFMVFIVFHGLTHFLQLNGSVERLIEELVSWVLGKDF
jgi:hypothetical protein